MKGNSWYFLYKILLPCPLFHVLCAGVKIAVQAEETVEGVKEIIFKTQVVFFLKYYSTLLLKVKNGDISIIIG